eukprot:Lankesteria_metandrocarpae@DN61_c0_g1_i1.p1
MMQKGNILLAVVALLSSTLAHIQVYRFGGPTVPIWVLGRDSVSNQNNYMKYKQWDSMARANNSITHYYSKIREIIESLKGYTLEHLAAHLNTDADILRRLPKYNHGAATATVDKLRKRDFEPQYMLLPDGTHLEIDMTKRVRDIPYFSTWDAAWHQLPICLPAEHSVRMPSDSLATVQAILRLLYLQPYFDHCSLNIPQFPKLKFIRDDPSDEEYSIDIFNAVSDTVRRQMKQFPDVKRYADIRDRTFFYNLNTVDDHFFRTTVDFTKQMVEDTDAHFKKLQAMYPILYVENQMNLGSIFETLPKNDSSHRWVVCADGSIHTFRVFSGQRTLVQELEWFAEWFYDWMQLEGTAKSLLEDKLFVRSHVSDVQGTLSDFYMAEAGFNGLLMHINARRGMF